MAGNFRRHRGDYRGMDCETYRLGISARLDGEDAGFDDAALAWHLASCEPCRRFESEAIHLTRAVRVASAESAPDLTPTIMAAINRERAAKSRRFDPEALRGGLIALAVVLASWGWDYVRRDRPIRLIVRSSYDPVAASLVPED